VASVLAGLVVAGETKDALPQVSNTVVPGATVLADMMGFAAREGTFFLVN
jgi:hypothetical protein